MTSASAREPAPDPAAGIGSLEAFLAAEIERDHARKKAEAFADQLPSLTSAERQQLTRLYTHERLAESKRLRRRLAQQQAAHEARERLRRRCITVAVLLGSFSVALTLGLILWTLR
ncbi:hypothetical protein [Streptomyces sp. NPDC048248]|uniref:hypothetical protein n=1 Tax=Streptomyces sp. NPDC048248 TaxID=3365523 RepID=UPI0037176E71